MKPKWPGITWNSFSDASGDAPRILGINPWIYDFAAYNLWSRPAGLLAGLRMLRMCHHVRIVVAERERTGVYGVAHRERHRCRHEHPRV